MLRITKTNKKVNYIEGCDLATTANLTQKQAETMAKMLNKKVEIKYLKASCNIESFLKVCDKIELSDTPFNQNQDDE